MGDSQPGFASTYACVVAVMRCHPRGLPTALHVHTTHPDSPEEPAADRLAALYPDWSERIVTIVAASLAVLVVALIAVVMGMA